MCSSQNFEAFPKGKKAKSKYCSHGSHTFTVFFFVSLAKSIAEKKKIRKKAKLEGILGMPTAT